MKIAVLHPWFLAKGGAEETVNALASAFPLGDIKCLLFEKEFLPAHLRSKNVRGLGLNWMPGKFHWYRHLLPYWPAAVETLDMRGYDLVITSDSNIMKGVIIDQNAIHICYCHTPMRCLWDLHCEYRESMPLLARPFFTIGTHHVRNWDFQAAQRVDHFVANSRYIERRIRKYYHRESTVIYPPVNSANGFISRHPEEYYLWLGRLTATKRIDLLIEACNRLGRKLVIAGTGREERRLKAMAGPTVQFLGRVPDSKIPDLYANCRAFLFAADEDFGIAPVEAQSYGRPVIAYGHGGSLETIRVNDRNGRRDTGVFFPEQGVESVVKAIRYFEEIEDSFDPMEIRKHSLQFDTAVFIRKFRAFVQATIAQEKAGDYGAEFALPSAAGRH